MGKTLYNCPLCKKQSAYISEYGLADSVICKCQGLNEVGRLVNSLYVPHNNQSNATTPPPVPTSREARGVASNGQPYVYGGNPVLPQGQGNKPVVNNANAIIQTSSFIIYHLSVDSEVEAAGHYFNNALSSTTGRQHYMQMGLIYYAEHSTDENKSLMFYVDNISREAVNFYGKNNATPSQTEIDQVKMALRKQGLITN